MKPLAGPQWEAAKIMHDATQTKKKEKQREARVRGWNKYTAVPAPSLSCWRVLLSCRVCVCVLVWVRQIAMGEREIERESIRIHIWEKTYLTVAIGGNRLVNGQEVWTDPPHAWTAHKRFRSVCTFRTNKQTRTHTNTSIHNNALTQMQRDTHIQGAEVTLLCSVQCWGMTSHLICTTVLPGSQTWIRARRAGCWHMATGSESGTMQ